MYIVFQTVLTALWSNRGATKRPCLATLKLKFNFNLWQKRTSGENWILQVGLAALTQWIITPASLRSRRSSLPDLIGQPEFAGEKTGCKPSNSWHVSMQDRLIQLDTADFDDFEQRTLFFSCDESMKAGFWLQSWLRTAKKRRTRNVFLSKSAELRAKTSDGETTLNGQAHRTSQAWSHTDPAWSHTHPVRPELKQYRPLPLTALNGHTGTDLM